MWLTQQLDNSWDTIVQPHSILGQFGILVARGEVTQGADCRLSNILFLPSTKHGMDQCLHTTILSHQSLRNNRLTRNTEFSCEIQVCSEAS